MRWHRLGRIFRGEGQRAWMDTHAGLPVAEHLDGSVYRFYFTSRDTQNRSHVGWLEVDINHPDQILRLSEEPLLIPGAAGRFDDAGVGLSSLVKNGAKNHFYYIGWSLRRSVPYHLAIGLALGDAGAPTPCADCLAGPIIERNWVDPLFCTAPTVMFDGVKWRMWYVSGVGWADENGSLVPTYHTRYGDSDDGVTWKREGRVVLETSGEQYGFSRPAIHLDNGTYRMWYSVRGRGSPYQLRFASSRDGLDWETTDQAGLEVSADGWDSEMITYPHVFRHESDLYMLYCGNGFGRTGFGLAVLGN